MARFSENICNSSFLMINPMYDCLFLLLVQHINHFDIFEKYLKIKKLILQIKIKYLMS